MPTLRLDAKCPSCGAPPAIRITVEERSFSLLLDPAVVRQSYQCPGRRTRPCGEIYLLPARAFHNAG